MSEDWVPVAQAVEVLETAIRTSGLDGHSPYQRKVAETQRRKFATDALVNYWRWGTLTLRAGRYRERDEKAKVYIVTRDRLLDPQIHAEAFFEWPMGNLVERSGYIENGAIPIRIEATEIVVSRADLDGWIASWQSASGSAAADKKDDIRAAGSINVAYGALRRFLHVHVARLEAGDPGLTEAGLLKAASRHFEDRSVPRRMIRNWLESECPPGKRFRRGYKSRRSLQ